MNPPFDFEANPLIPVVIQDDASRDVLMVGFMNQLAFEKTRETGYVHFWSRSRNQLWKKGETSGHTQEVVSMAVNCEDNSLLVQVLQTGAVCHTGHTTCFYRQVLPNGELFETSDPVFDPAEVYRQPLHPAEIARSKRKKRRQNEGTWFIGAWYGAYEYLSQQPLQDVSGTSKLLHDQVWPFDRIADEMDELAGVLSGDHAHSGDLEQDVILEGSQVLYWLNLLAIGTTQEWDRDLNLENVLLPQDHSSVSPEESISRLRAAAATWRRADGRLKEEEGDYMEELIRELVDSYWLVSEAVSPIVPPHELIEHDLEELRSKTYLADYFASADA
jgi:phosphoribosyl-AMP cyclohydrolase